MHRDENCNIHGILNDDNHETRLKCACLQTEWSREYLFRKQLHMLMCRNTLSNVMLFSASRMQRCSVHCCVIEVWDDFWPKYNTSLFSVIMTCNTHNCLLFQTTLRKINVCDVISYLPAVFREHTVCTTVRHMLPARHLSCPWRWCVVCNGWTDHAVTWYWT